jgi:hypothetical protein
MHLYILKIVSRVNTYTVKPPIVYLDSARACNSLIDTPWECQFICRNICRGCKYILYLLIIFVHLLVFDLKLTIKCMVCTTYKL